MGDASVPTIDTNHFFLTGIARCWGRESFAHSPESKFLKFLLPYNNNVAST